MNQNILIPMRDSGTGFQLRFNGVYAIEEVTLAEVRSTSRDVGFAPATSPNDGVSVVVGVTHYGHVADDMEHVPPRTVDESATFYQIKFHGGPSGGVLVPVAMTMGGYTWEENTTEWPPVIGPTLSLEVLSSTSARLTWARTDSIPGGQVQIEQKNFGGSFGVVHTSASGSGNVTFTGLDSAHAVYWRARLVESTFGDGDYSLEALKAPGSIMTAVPVNAVLTSTSVTVSIGGVNATGVNAQIRLAADDSVVGNFPGLTLGLPVNPSYPTGVEFFQDGLAPATDYYIWCEPLGWLTASPAFQTLSFTTPAF